jgi:hypothetical protein
LVKVPLALLLEAQSFAVRGIEKPFILNSAVIADMPHLPCRCALG